MRFRCFHFLSFLIFNSLTALLLFENSLLQKYLIKSHAPIFGGLSVTAIDLICKNLAFVSYGDGDILFMQGDVGDAFYIVSFPLSCER